MAMNRNPSLLWPLIALRVWSSYRTEHNFSFCTISSLQPNQSLDDKVILTLLWGDLRGNEQHWAHTLRGHSRWKDKGLRTQGAHSFIWVLLCRWEAGQNDLDEQIILMAMLSDSESCWHLLHFSVRNLKLSCYNFQRGDDRAPPGACRWLVTPRHQGRGRPFIFTCFQSCWIKHEQNVSGVTNTDCCGCSSSP